VVTLSRNDAFLLFEAGLSPKCLISEAPKLRADGLCLSALLFATILQN
jgi:hypothetical protein